jgi:hypothetical protein
MNRYTPIWDKLTDSSVWDEPYHVRILWITMLALKDRDHVVRCEAYTLRKRANITAKETEDGLKVLSSPDRKRGGQEYGGRRIVKHGEGWEVLNGQVYQALMQRANLREYKRRKQAEYRARGLPKQTPLKGEREYEEAVRREDGAGAGADRIAAEGLDVEGGAEKG